MAPDNSREPITMDSMSESAETVINLVCNEKIRGAYASMSPSLYLRVCLCLSKLFLFCRQNKKD